MTSLDKTNIWLKIVIVESFQTYSHSTTTSPGRKTKEMNGINDVNNINKMKDLNTTTKDIINKQP